MGGRYLGTGLLFLEQFDSPDNRQVVVNSDGYDCDGDHVQPETSPYHVLHFDVARSKDDGIRRSRDRKHERAGRSERGRHHQDRKHHKIEF